MQHYHYLARRAVETLQIIQDPKTMPGGENDDGGFQMPKWGIALLLSTVVALMMMSGAIQYTYEHVVATLAMVESPYELVLVKAERSTDPDAPLLTAAEEKTEQQTYLTESAVIKVRPVTSKFRTAIRHLRARAGRLSRFRGFSLAVVYHFLHHSLTGLLIFLLPFDHFIARPIASIISAVVLARYSLAWTLIVISEPSKKAWYKRMPPMKTWKKVAPATALWAVSRQVTLCLPIVLCRLFEFDRVGEKEEITVSDVKLVIFQAIVVLLVWIGTAVAVLVPATVTMRRVHASLLPEEDEAIVNFDRTFEGKVVPEIIGGSGTVGMIEAWRGFDMGSRARLLLIYAKVFGMVACLSIVGSVILIGELHLIMGNALIEKINAHMGHF